MINILYRHEQCAGYGRAGAAVERSEIGIEFKNARWRIFLFGYLTHYLGNIGELLRLVQALGIMVLTCLLLAELGRST